MKKILFPAVACFIFIFAAQLQAQSLSGVSRDEIEQYIANGEDENAQAALLEALASENFPDRNWARKQYYVIADRRGVLAQAIEDLEQKVKENPNDDTLLLSLSQGYERTKEWGRAVDIYERLLKRSPEDGVLAKRLLNFYMLQGNYDSVIKVLEPAVQNNPHDKGASDMLAHAYTKAGKAKEATQLYEQKIKEEPNSAGLRGTYAQALMNLGRLEDAAAEWEKAFELDPDNLFFKQKLAETYLELEKYPQAKEEYQDLERRASAAGGQPWFKNIAAGQLRTIDDKVREKSD